MTGDERAAMHRIAALFYEAGHADGREDGRREALCLPPRVPNATHGSDLPPRRLTVVKP